MAKWDLTLPSLYKTFEKYFMIGNIISPYDFKDEEVIEMYKYHYNAVTAENAMKPEAVSRVPGEYDFSVVDKLVDWAGQNGINVIGHTLNWHAQSPKWLNRNEDGTPLPREKARTNLEAFIKEYVSRYSGRIYSWDVINEMFIDSGGEKEFTGNWRDYVRRETENFRAVGHWYLAYANGADASKGECGSDYAFDAFYFARKYDPKAILYYNDYNEEFLHKCTLIPQMVDDLNARWRAHAEYDGRLLVGGIGMQSHHNHVHTDVENIRSALEAFSKTGAKIAITEMDFTFGSHEEPASPLTPEQSKKQTEMYTELFKLYMEYSDHIERVTFWGKDDKHSWRAWGSPLLFDAESQPKEAFRAVVGLVG